MTVCPRRSALYMPASNAKAVNKARTLDCDVVILDLEDAVAPEAKDMAREQAVEAVIAGGFGHREVVVRVNGLDTPWGADDLKAVAAAGPDGVLVPKINDGADIARYNNHLSRAPEATRLWAMIETCRCLFQLHDIAGAANSSRLGALVMGTNDLAKEMGASLAGTREPFFGALGLSVAAARMGGLTILDGVYNGIDDHEGFERQCQQGLAFGFDGKTLIHPAQVDICNRVFTPSDGEIAYARSVIAAYALPENTAKGAIRVEGKMAERLHLAQAEKLVAIAETLRR